MNAASRLSHISPVSRRAALLAALLTAPAVWAANTGGHVEQVGSDYIYVGDTSPVTIEDHRDTYNGAPVYLASAYGGKSETADVTGWSLTLKGQPELSSHVYGGWIGGSAHSHTVSENLVLLVGDAQVGDQNAAGGNVYGGYSAVSGKAAGDVAARDNTVVLAEQAQVWNGFSSGLDNGSVFGGYAVTGSVTGNKVRIALGKLVHWVNNSFVESGTSGVVLAGHVQGNVTANHAEAGSATGGNDLEQPDVSIEAVGGTVIEGNVIGGASGSDGAITGHVVKIAGGEVQGNIYGGKGNGGRIEGNTIVLAGEAKLDDSTLYGHEGGDPAGSQNNTLRVEVKGEQVKALRNFDTWHFALPSDLKQGDTMLTVSSQGDFLEVDGSRLTVSTDGGQLALGLGEHAALLLLADGSNIMVPSGALQTAWLDGEPTGLPALVYHLDHAVAVAPGQLDMFLDEKYLYGTGGTNSPGQRETGNTLTLASGTANAAFGGRALNGDVSGNTLIIDGAATLKPLGTSHPSYDLSGKAYGGYADAGNATGNTVTLSSNMSGQAAGFALYGGFSGNGGEATSGNTLQ
ncbi:MAG: hypothetical protein IJR28_00200, partial [Ottowia sp.]|nr:hypothetical protein [Ottowia sp.]